MTDAAENGRPYTPEWTRGDRLRKARELAGLNQERVGELLADLNNGKPFKHSTIAAWERDQSQPRDLMAVIGRWAEITNVDPAWLLGFQDRPYSSLGQYQPCNYVNDFRGQMELFNPDVQIQARELELVKA